MSTRYFIVEMHEVFDIYRSLVANQTKPIEYEFVQYMIEAVAIWYRDGKRLLYPGSDDFVLQYIISEFEESRQLDDELGELFQFLYENLIADVEIIVFSWLDKLCPEGDVLYQTNVWDWADPETVVFEVHYEGTSVWRPEVQFHGLYVQGTRQHTL